MGDNYSDADTSRESPNLKRSSRAKKQKRFFDEDAKAASSAKKAKNIKKEKLDDSDEIVEVTVSPIKQPTKDKVKVQIDDEEQWLEALEKGELDDNGDLPKERDVTLMTARQRAMLDRASTPILVEDDVAPVKEELSEEAKKKKEEKNIKRKLQAVKRAEENKKQTIEKLVVGTKRSIAGSNQSKLSSETPMIVYKSTLDATTLFLPKGYDYPLKAQQSVKPPIPKNCAICGEARKYDCSKTGKALCSLACYKANIKLITA